MTFQANSTNKFKIITPEGKVLGKYRTYNVARYFLTKKKLHKSEDLRIEKI